MAKKAIGQVKLQIPAGKATPAPPVGPALGQAQINIMEFCKQFNARTNAKELEGLIIPVVVTVWNDRSFTFITKTPPASVLLKRAAGIAKGSGTPNKDKVGKVTEKQVEEIARQKMPDLNAASIESAIKSVKGLCPRPGRVKDPAPHRQWSQNYGRSEQRTAVGDKEQQCHAKQAKTSPTRGKRWSTALTRCRTQFPCCRR